MISVKCRVVKEVRSKVSGIGSVTGTVRCDTVAVNSVSG